MTNTNENAMTNDEFWSSLNAAYADAGEEKPAIYWPSRNVEIENGTYSAEITGCTLAQRDTGRYMHVHLVLTNGRRSARKGYTLNPSLMHFLKRDMLALNIDAEDVRKLRSAVEAMCGATVQLRVDVNPRSGWQDAAIIGLASPPADDDAADDDAAYDDIQDDDTDLDY